MLRQRGRLASRIATENGFDGYHCLSYVELEFITDEESVLNELVMAVFELDRPKIIEIPEPEARKSNILAI